MNKNNILIIRSDIKLAGPGILILETAKQLKRMGNNVIVCSSGGDVVNELNECGIKHYTISGLAVGTRNILNNFKTISAIRKILSEENINIIHGFNAASTMLAYIASITNFRRIKSVNTVLGETKEWFLRIVPFKLIAVSNYLKERLVRLNVNENKIFVLHNGIIDLSVFDINSVDSKSVRSEMGIKDDEILIGSVAVITGGKGHKQIIESAPSIIKENDKVKFVLVGDGAKKDEYEKIVRDMGLDDKIIFLGKRRDIPRIMASFDIFVHMSEVETFGMVLIEAMAMGKAVVARNVGGIPEVVSEGETGYLVNDNDEFSNRVIELVNCEDLRNKFGNRGLEVVKNKFVVEALGRNLADIYSKIK